MDAVETRFARTARSKTFRNIVRTFGLDQKAVFDIGSSYGEFLAHFGPNGVGLTIVPEEADYGRRHGLDIRVGNVEAPNVPVSETFDAIFANNLLEHLLSPHRFLVDIKRFLKPNGVLILGVPCIPTIAWLVRFRKFRGALAAAHVNFFTRTTLRLSVERAGWRAIACRGFRFKTPFLNTLLSPSTRTCT